MRQIDSTGRIINGNPLIKLQPFRLLIITISITILFITNPANELLSIQPSRTSNKNGIWRIVQRPIRKYVGSYSFDLFGFEFDLFQSKKYKLIQSDSRLTNYVIFSLDKGDKNGVFMSILNQKIQICSYDYDGAFFGEVCDWIADTMCHGMTVFDPKNRPFTAHRISSYILILFMILSSCSSYGYIQPVASLYNLYHHSFSILLSVLTSQPNIETFVFLNFYIYPYFSILDKIVSSRMLDSDKHFYGYALFLFFGLGSFVNLVSSILTNSRGYYGIHGAVAAALGYVNRLSPSREIVKGLGSIRLTASDVLLAYFVVSVLDASFTTFSKIIGFRHGYYAKFVLPWILGGMAGNLLGIYHLEHYGLWWVY